MQGTTKRAALAAILAFAAALAAAAEGGGADERTPAAEAYAFGFGLDLAYEYRLGPPEPFLIETTAVKSGADLMRSYFERAPLASVSLEYGKAEGLSLALGFRLGAAWTGDYGKADNLPGPGNGEPLALENYFISRGILRYAWGDSYVAFGRDKPDYGGILRGSLLPGERLPYLDALRARLQMDAFALEWMAASIPALPSYDGQDVNPNWGVLPAEAPSYGWEFSAEPTAIVEVLNRFSWKLGDFVLGLSDHAMLARRNNRFYLTDFFPVCSRHQTAGSQTNNSMVLDLSWRPIEGLELRAEAGFDDISAEIFGVADTGSPTIDAYVLGGEYRARDARGSTRARLELGYTHYLWGNYDGSEIRPNDVNPFLRFQYRFLMDTGDALLLPLSSPYGPGALWAEASYSRELTSMGLRLGAELRVLSKNEEANLIDTAVLGNTTTAGARRLFFASLALPVEAAFGPWTLRAAPAILVRDGEWRPEATLGARYSLRAGSARRR